MRINARLDESFEEKFKYIQQTEGKNRSDVVKEALERYFAVKLKQKEQTALEKNQQILRRVAGIAVGPDDLSETYKERMHKALKEKYAID